MGTGATDADKAFLTVVIELTARCSVGCRFLKSEQVAMDEERGKEPWRQEVFREEAWRARSVAPPVGAGAEIVAQGDEAGVSAKRGSGVCRRQADASEEAEPSLGAAR